MRRTRETSRAGAIRLIDKRLLYATRSTTVADRAISNVLVFRELNVAQLESDIVITLAHTALASREVQSDAPQRKAARIRTLRRRQKNG